MLKINIPGHTKALLLDLGGVLIDLQMHRTYEAFDCLGFKNFDQHFDSYSGSTFIEAYEEGKSSSEEFLSCLLNKCNPGTTTAQVIAAWNALLANVPFEKYAQLNKWNKQYDLYLYSNTNALHVAHLNQYYNQRFGVGKFQGLFKKIYYSHELGIRKPSEAGYLHIMKEQNLLPNELYYIEDGSLHFATAQRLGIPGQLWIMNEPFT
jgi:putative hydrolase of the HAD superfamily